MIKRNMAKCAKCGTVIESAHVHDYQVCRCGLIMVDGGREYLRRGFRHESDFIDLSVVTSAEEDRMEGDEVPMTWMYGE